MSAAQRAERTVAADALCVQAFESVSAPTVGVALVAVGGFGRRELAPFSDLDVILVIDDDVEVGDWAGALWYPLWDSGTKLDHSVRSFADVVETATADLRVMLGLLDARHLAGDPNLTLRLRTTILTQWRRDARSRLLELKTLGEGRASLLGELAHSSVPDLKESVGGLRDATVLNALVASWLVDVPHVEVERSRTALLDVRDALHDVAGRGTDRVAPEFWPEIAARLGFADGTDAQRRTRAHARRLRHLSRLTWSRAEATVRKPSLNRRPQLETIAPGIALSHGEVVLDKATRPTNDGLLLLSAAAHAAERGLTLSPATAARLVRECPPLPTPWPRAARELVVRLLAAGRGLEAVWETLDETGAVASILPEWEQIRLLPHASVVHRFTVDRHVIETCIEASGLIRRVARPDLLMMAALLHDIGKGGTVPHSVAGAPLAHTVALRMGFSNPDAQTISTLVRWHLLLPETATTRDPDDPATATQVTTRIGDLATLDLLMALTEADARATSDTAWSTWRAGLIRSLFRRCASLLDAEVAPETGAHQAVALPNGALLNGVPPNGVLPDGVLRTGSPEVIVEPLADGARVSVIAPDRIGLLADAAAMLAVQRASVRAARVWTEGGYAFSQWEVADSHLDPALLKQRLEAIVAGRLDAPTRLTPSTAPKLEPSVEVQLGASKQATVVEIRAEDRPGLIYAVCRAVATFGLSIRSAHVTTIGPQAVDVFYVQDTQGQALNGPQTQAMLEAIREGLRATVSA